MALVWPLLLSVTGGANDHGCHYTTQCIAGSCGPGGHCTATPSGDLCPLQECGQPLGLAAPRFHVRGASCGMNDPNGPFWDEKHGMYHLFWQSHESMVHNDSSSNGTVTTVCGGPVWGHAVSRNLSHWTRLTVALWNDRWFDLNAVYTGSTTIVGSIGPVIVYPGICDRAHPGCPKSWGVALATAVPANISDPFLETWVKRGPGPSGSPKDNPFLIGNEPLKDPSSAWQTSQGEWRMTTAGGDIYTSLDFIQWSKAPLVSATDNSAKHLFGGGECPSFFPLPRLVPGRTFGNTPVDRQPTHVFKYSHDGSKDYVVMGIYTEGAPNSSGTWTALTPARVVDNGAFYAGKDFAAPAQRRLMYGWARVPGIQSLARELTYDPLLQQICYNPLPELTALRQKPLINLSTSVTVQPGMANSLSLGNWSGGSLGNSSEVWARFKIPIQHESLDTNTNVTFGVGIMTADRAPHWPSRLAFVEFQHPPALAAWPVYVYNVTVGVRSPTPLRSGLNDGGSSGGFEIVDTLQLTSEDVEIDVRVFFDSHVAEIFFMNGRVAMTVGIQATKRSGCTIFTQGGNSVEVSGVEAWHMGSIWVPKSEQLHPRHHQS